VVADATSTENTIPEPAVAMFVAVLFTTEVAAVAMVMFAPIAVPPAFIVNFVAEAAGAVLTNTSAPRL
jgi:hypothetical protein